MLTPILLKNANPSYTTGKRKNKISTSLLFWADLGARSPRPVALASQGTCWKEKLSGPTPDKRIRTSRNGAEQSVFQ